MISRRQQHAFVFWCVTLLRGSAGIFLIEMHHIDAISRITSIFITTHAIIVLSAILLQIRFSSASYVFGGGREGKRRYGTPHIPTPPAPYAYVPPSPHVEHSLEKIINE